MNLAENIRFYREKHSMYQSDLGKALGVSAQAVSKWELGKAEPDGRSISKMCDIFSISIDELFGREQKTPATAGGMDDALIDLLAGLPQDDVQRVRDFVAGLKAARTV